VALDEGSSRGSRITFQDKEGEDQGLTAPKASTSRVAVHGTGPAYDRGGCFCSLRFEPASCRPLFLSPSDMDTDGTREKESELAEASRGMCRYSHGVDFP
jgi:hypothetical protein